MPRQNVVHLFSIRYWRPDDVRVQSPFQMTVQCQTNDDEWHTLYVRRRANYLQAWVDDCRPESGIIAFLVLFLCIALQLA